MTANHSSPIREALCFDGLENFAGSQYDPNNINQLIGRDSLFIYDFNLASLNRKGRQSPRQRARLAEIEASQGRYDSSAIRVATVEILRRNHPRCAGGRMHLLSDEHFQYRRAVSSDLRHLRFEHVTISSRACRNFQNILFSVNHTDMIIRQRVAAFTRETISFSKNPAAMCQRYALFLVHKNYMCTQFTKKHIRRPQAYSDSPAQAAGLCDHILEYAEIFDRRSIREPEFLNREWSYYYRGEIPPEQRRNRKFRRRQSSAAGTVEGAQLR